MNLIYKLLHISRIKRSKRSDPNAWGSESVVHDGRRAPGLYKKASNHSDQKEKRKSIFRHSFVWSKAEKEQIKKPGALPTIV